MPSKATNTMDINHAIREQIKIGNRIIKVKDLRGQHAISVGISKNVEIIIEGTAGDYMGALNMGAVISLRPRGSPSSAGSYMGDMMVGGGILVTGDVGDFTGCYMKGGIILIRGDAGNNLGTKMQGGVIIVNGSVGEHCGSDMRGGDIIVTGDTGEGMGAHSSDGTIYVGGETKKPDMSMAEKRLNDADIKKLKTYFKHYKIDANIESFSKFISRRGVKE